MKTTTKKRPYKTGSINLAPPTDVTIKLKVMAKRLYAYGVNYDQTDINDLCELSDGTELSPFGANKDNFVSEVDLDKDVIWLAKVNEPKGDDKDYKVEVVSYDYKDHRPNNTNFFNSSKIPDTNGIVTGHVKNDPALKTKEDIYAIDFRITEISSGKYHLFTIDPKLKINPKYQLFVTKP